jgi:hypothetical protein
LAYAIWLAVPPCDRLQAMRTSANAVTSLSLSRTGW